MANNDNIKWVYDQLTSRGANLGSVEDFSKAMGDSANRKWAYDYASNAGLNLGSEDDFAKAIAPQQPAQPTSRLQNFVNKATESLKNIGNQQQTAQQPTQQAPAQAPTQQQVQPKPTSEAPDSTIMQGATAPVANSTINEMSEAWNKQLDEQAFVKKLAGTTEERRKSLIAQHYLPELNKSFDDAIAEKYDKRTIAQNKSQIEKMRAEFLNSQLEDIYEQSKSVTKDYAGSLAKEQGQRKEYLRQNPQYDPSRYTDIEEKYNRPLEYGETPEYREELKRQEKRDRFKELEREAAIGQQVRSEIEQRRLERRLEAAKDKRFIDPTNVRSWLESEDESILKSAIGQREKEQQVIQDELDDAGFLKGLSNSVTDASNWTMGLSDLSTLTAMQDIKKKLENGEQLSEAQQMLLDAAVARQGAEDAYAGNRGMWYNIGEGVGTSLTDLPSYAVGMGMMKTIAKGVFKQAVKSGTRLGINMAERSFPSLLVKATGVSTGTLTAGATFVNTVQLPKVVSKTMEKMLGKPVIDENGNYKFEDAEDFFPALWHAEQELIPEAASEVGGEFMPKVGSVVDKGLRKTRLTKLANGIERMVKSDSWQGYNQLLEKVGWHGLTSEALEEYLGDIQSLMIGDPSGIFGDENGKGGWDDPEKHLQIWLTTAALGPILNAPRFAYMGYSKAGHYIYEQKAGRADQQAQDIFGKDAWQTLRATIDDTDNEQMPDVARSIMEGAFSDEQKAAAMKYINNVTKMRAYNIGELATENTPTETPVQPRVSHTAIDGKTLIEYDEAGNEIRRTDYDTEEDAQAANVAVLDKRDNDDMLADYEVLNQVDPEQAQAVFDDFAQRFEMTPERVMEIMQTDPFARTEDEVILANMLAQALHEAAYPDGVAHPEQSFQDGQKTADETPLEPVQSVEISSQPTSQQAQLDALQQQAAEAQQALDAYLKNHDDVREGLLYTFGKKDVREVNPIEAIDYIQNNFSGSERDEAIALYANVLNASTKLNGYQLRIQNKVDEYINNEVQSRTFKGTINGQPSAEDGIYTINDGSQEYTLVHGNIAMTPEGRVDPDASEESVLALDNDGTFQRIKTSGIMTVTQGSMQAFADNLRAQYTPVSPEAEAAPATADEGATTQSEQAGEEAGAPATGANESPAAASPETQAEVPANVQGGQQTIESVTDKDGVKRYEQGIAVDDAIADMVQDGLDVNEEADLAINEAQEELDKIKAPKTRAERVKNEARRRELQNTIDYYNNVKTRWGEVNAEEQPVEQPQKSTLIKSWQTKKGRKVELFIMPETVDEDGNRHVKIGRSVDGGEISTGHANGIDVSTGLIDYEATYGGNDEVEERDKEDGTRYQATEIIYLPDGRILARGTISGDKASFWLKGDPLAPAESEENINVQPEQTTIKEKPVSSQQNITVEEQKQQRIAEAKTKYGELFDDDFTKANDVYELVSMWVGRKRNLAWDDVNGKRGLQKELGWTRKIGGDTKFIETLLAKKGDGMGVDEFVHMVWESPENDINGEKRWDDTEIKEALLELLKSAQSKSDVVDRALNTRIEQAEASLQEQQRRAEEEALNPTAEEVVLTNEDIEKIESERPFEPMSDEEAANDPFLKNFDANGKYTYKSNDDEYNRRSQGLDGTNEQEGTAIGGSESIRGGEGEESAAMEDLRGLEEGWSEQGGANKLADVLQSPEPVPVRTRTDSEAGSNNQAEEAGGANQQSQRSAEYLEPRNAEEEAIVQNVINQLQQEIQSAVEDVDKARADLEKARARESNRATDLFANDKTFAEPDAIFSQEEMGLDTSAEGVERRTRAERENLQEAVNKLNQLQSIKERNSRIRGAFDNHRRQTSFGETDQNIKNRHQEEYEKYIKPLLNRSDEELQQMAKKMEDAVGGDLSKLGGNLEYSAIMGMLVQRELNRQRKDVKNFIANTIDDEDVSFVDKATQKEINKLNSLIDEYGVDDSEGKIEDYVKQLRKKYPAEEKTENGKDYRIRFNKDGSITINEETINPKGKNGPFDHDDLYRDLTEIGGRWNMGDNWWTIPADKAEEADEIVRKYIGKRLSSLSNDELQKIAKEKEDAANGDEDVLYNDPEYTSIINLIEERSINNPLETAQQAKKEKEDEWEYELHYNDQTGRAWITRQKNIHGIPLQDGRFYIEGKNLAELRAILENPKNNLGPVLSAVEVQLHNAEVTDTFNKVAQETKKKKKKEKEYGADNKLVTTERYEELKKRMKQKMRGQMNMGVDPEILAIGTEMAVYHIEAGARKFIDYATNMINDLGDAIRPYLKAFYEGARRLPEMSELSKEMDSVSDVDSFDVLNYDKQEANTVNEHKEKNNEPKNVVSSQENTEETVERKVEDEDKYRAFSQAVANDMLNAMETGVKPYKSIGDIRRKAKEVGLDSENDILLQELVEDGLVSAARQYVNTYLVRAALKGQKASDVRKSKELFDDIVELYNLQPTISQRSGNRIQMGQFSTPLPMSFIADVFAYNDSMDDVLEPTAGNGMMVFAVPENTVTANELDKTRLENLKAQKFKKVTNGDATEPDAFCDGTYDAVIANPPFGSAEAKDYDGKTITSLDQQIALNALSKMKDNGRAAIIIGGNMKYANNGSVSSDKAFWTYLYDHYNVKGVIDMDGKLFQKQGTTYPTRMILIDGRRSEADRAQTTVYPPVQSQAPQKATTFDELYDIAQEIQNSKLKTNGNEILRTPTNVTPVGDTASGNTTAERRSGESYANDTNERRADSRGSNGETQQPVGESVQKPATSSEGRVSRPANATVSTAEENTAVSEAGGTSQGGRIGTDRRSEPQRVQGVGAAGSRVGLTTPAKTPAEEKKKEDELRSLETEKLSYRPHNSAFSLQSVAPAAMVEAMDKTLAEIEKEHGSIDEFIRKELGYDTIEEAHNALAAEQMDSVAMSIVQMKNGQALIIGDQTGVGKGRQMAALIRWACRQGKKPIFITQKSDLFSDIYRDLVDVGSGDLKPFIFNSDGAMVDANGITVHKPLSAAAQARVYETGELPEGYDFAVLTYSQVNTGDAISQEEAGKKAKDSGARGTKKSKAVKEGKATPKATYLRKIAKDNYMFLDESHTAAGQSNTGAYIQSLLKDAKAATFASATFAKRPDTMPMYALRTSMNKAKVEADKLIEIIEKGGVTLQEIMSRALTESGQMVRRERDMSDVVTDWKTIDDPETVRRARENYDKTITAFNAIIQFQEVYVKPKVDAMDAEMAIMAETVGLKKGTEKMGVENVPFASKTYNYTKQLMLALKVDAIAEEVERQIKEGKHPVIALESTMESSISDYAPGDVIAEPTFSASLIRGLETVMQYTIKDDNGKETHQKFTPASLGTEGEKAYHDLEELIRESTKDIFISPLDAIIAKLNEKGYKVGELTGRNLYVEMDGGKATVRRRTDKDKKRMQRDFNSGALDVLILNKSASTGISLHASEKFKDQRQRVMVIAQPLSDINDYMQMIGRIDRTGQVHRGYYINLGLPVPAENRFLMMLSTKLKSLNANTTTSQDSESNDVEAPDLLNKYGSQVVIEYLRDNRDIYEKMGEPLKKSAGAGRVRAAELDDYIPQEDDARKITGYVALLSTAEQESFYDDVVRRYNDLINYLNDTGSNDLKINVMPLRAKTIEKQVSSKGVDPTGTNPFARDAYVELVEMDVLRKPMKASEVQKVIDQLNPSADRIQQLRQIVNKDTEEKLDKEDARYEEAKKKAEKDIAAYTEKINGQQKRSAEEKRDAIEEYTDNKERELEERHEQNMLKIEDNRDKLERRFSMFKVGQTYLIPDDLNSLTFATSTPGIFCGFKAKDNKITLSTTQAVFCTLDGRRKIEIKLSDLTPLTNIQNNTNQNWDAAQQTTLDNWDSQIPAQTRKKGFIMTGNILQAVADTQDQMGNYPGQLISYTDIDGNIHDGILMPDRWNPNMLKGSQAPINARLEQIKNLEKGDGIVSADEKVRIFHFGNRYNWKTGKMEDVYALTVPKSKKEGQVYYLNNQLRDLMISGDFFSRAGAMRADFRAEELEKVVNILSSLGVKVKDASNVNFDNVQDNSLDSGYSEETDEEVIERLEKEPKIKVYRAMQLIDGKLYPPMAAKQGGKLVNPSELGKWEKADEHPEMADDNGRFKLDKGNGKSLKAAYNPYIHTSTSMLNDQFSEAQSRPNLVVVEMEVPESELTSGYKAEKAKDSVGKMDWKAGVIQGQLTGTREVILTRWAKPVRIVPAEEVAKSISNQIKGKVEVMPSNVVTPEQRKELEKLGVKFVETDNRGKLTEGEDKGKTYSSVYGKNAKGYSEELEPGVQETYDRLQQKYNSLPITITRFGADDKTLIDALFGEGSYDGQPEEGREEAMAEIRKDLEKDSGGYNPDTKKIVIFADRSREGVHPFDDHEERFFHENLHGILHKWYGDKERGIADRFWNATPNKVGRHNKSLVEKYYDKERQKEEFFVRCMAEAMLDGDIKRIEEYLKEDAADIQRVNELLNEIGYDRAREKAERNAEQTSYLGGNEDVSKEGLASSNRGRGLDKSRIRNRINLTLRKLGTKDRTTIVNSMDEVEDSKQRRHIEQMHRQGKKVYGWFKGGKVYIFLPDIDSEYKAEQTIWHETVGHVGLRNLIGDENYKHLLYTIWKNNKATDSDMVEWVTRRQQENGWEFYKAMDEWLAREAEKTIAEKQSRNTLWQKITGWLADTLKSIGYRFAPNINDTRYLFWLSQNHIDPTNPISEAKRNALLRKLDNDFVDGMDSDMTTGYSEDVADNQARDNYEHALKRLSYAWKEAHIDALQSAVELARAMSGKKKMEDIPSFENFILSLNQLSSKEDAMDFLFNRDYMKPVADAIAKILPDLSRNRAKAMRKLQLYMIQKHGLERNRVLFVRDALRSMRMDEANGKLTQGMTEQAEAHWEWGKNKLFDDLTVGYIDLREYFEKLDELIRDTFDPSYNAAEHDYSGLTSMEPDINGTYDDAAIIDDVMNTESMLSAPDGSPDGRLEDLWERTNALSNFSLQMEYEAGLIDKKTYDHVSGMFNWYVPLRGYDETTAEDVYDYLEEKNPRNFTGPTLMNARGRKSIADVDVFATLGAMGSRSIHNALTNQAKQSFARFVRNHSKGDKPLVTELGFAWAEKVGVDASGEDIWEEVQPDIPENATGDEVADILDQFEQEMRQKQANGEARRIRKSDSIPYRFIRREDKNQHIVDAWIGGERHQFIVNGNPRAAQAINGQLNANRGSNILWMSSLSHFMAKLNTSYSPDFIVRNTMRDAIFAFTNTGIKESPKYIAKWVKNYLRMMGRMLGGTPIDGTNLFERYRKNELRPGNKTDMYFKEYMENGGQTGWVEMKNKEKWKKIVEEGVKAKMSGKGKEYAAKVLTFIPDLIENMNERAENMARFATYMTSREMGRSIKRSVSDAKEISVNFNRKGAGKKTSGFTGTGDASSMKNFNSVLAGWSAQNLQDYIMFYNAGIQAVNNLAKVVGAHPIKAATAFSAFALGAFLMPALNAFLQEALGGDDDKDKYAELPEWMRRNNICIYAGEDIGFITISLPIEMRAMYGIGDMAASYLDHPELRNEKNPAVDILSQLSQIMPLDFMGEQTGNPLWTLVPSGAKPVLEAAFNVNWQGRPIEREQSRWNKDQPRWMLAYKNTNDLYVNASKALNAATNAYSEDDLRKMGISEDQLKEVDASIKGWADGKLTDPALVQHVIEGYFGGAGKTVNNFAHMVKMFEDGENWMNILKSDKTPILRTLHNSPTEQNQNARTRNKWFYYQSEAQRTKEEVKRLKQAGVIDPYANIRSISEEDSLRSMRAQEFEKAEKAYNKIKKVLDRTTDLDEKRIYQMRLDSLMSSTVQLLDGLQ